MKRAFFPVREMLAVIFGMASLSAAWSQGSPGKAPVFELSTLRLGDMEIPPLYYTEVSKGLDGKSVTVFRPLEIGSGARRGPYEIPLLPPVSLFTGDPEAKDGQGMKVWGDVPVRSPGDRLVLLFYFDSKGRPAHRFLDDSREAHPAGSVRVLNCLDAPVAFSAGNRKASVPPGTEASLVPAPDAQGRFDFAFFADASGHAPPKRLYFPGPAGRLLVVYSLSPDFVADGKMLPDGPGEMKRIYEPSARRLFDQAPEK